jgi:hypothetical protein
VTRTVTQPGQPAGARLYACYRDRGCRWAALGASGPPERGPPSVTWSVTVTVTGSSAAPPGRVSHRPESPARGHVSESRSRADWPGLDTVIGGTRAQPGTGTKPCAGPGPSRGCGGRIVRIIAAP